MTTIYVYLTKTKEVHAQFHGETLEDCYDQAYDACYLGADGFEVSTSQFGLVLLAPNHPNNANYSGIIGTCFKQNT